MPWFLPTHHQTAPYGDVMDADVLLGHVEEQVRQLDVQEEGQVLGLPAHIQQVQQAGLHTGQRWQQCPGAGGEITDLIPCIHTHTDNKIWI